MAGLKFAGTLFFIFALFPAVSIVPLPIQTDTQPNALFMAILVCLVGRRVPLPLPVWTLLVLFTGALILFISDGATIDGLRSLLGYLTIFIVAAATLVLRASGIRLPDRLLDFSVYIWTFVGAVQLILWHPFMTFLVTASRTTETRGVTSLSNEPSLYATTMIFFIILYFVRRREQSFPVVLCLVQIALFSQSVLGILFVLMMLGLYVVLRFSAPTAIIALVGLFASSFALFTYGDNLLAGTRIGGLLVALKGSPWRILQLDQSVSSRLASIFYSIKGALDSALVPHGFEAWKKYSSSENLLYKDLFNNQAELDRIMSGYGSALFEMGWVGLTVPFLITLGAIRSIWRDSATRAICFLVLVHLLLLTPVPLTFPLVGLLIGELFSSLSTSPSRPIAAARTC